MGMSHAIRTPNAMRVRGAVRAAFRRLRNSSSVHDSDSPLVLVALSGGADSLALAAASAAEMSGAGVRVGAVIVDHGLQDGSAQVAAAAARQAQDLGLDPVTVHTVQVESGRASRDGGVESAARRARYEALIEAATSSGAEAVMTAHTRNDQAEQVLLGLVRGSGTRSLAGIPLERIDERTGVCLLRPLLDESAQVTRNVTEAACAELELDFWRDPHNHDTSFTRVRVRERVLPFIERELGAGVAANLARSSDLAREDADALDIWARQAHEAASESCGGHLASGEVSATLAVDVLSTLPTAVLHRVIRLAVTSNFGRNLTREHTLAIASLVTAWKGQGPILVPSASVTREQHQIVFRPAA